MSRERWLGVAATLLVILAGAWLYGSPYLTLWEFRKAVAARDVDALSAHVDYTALHDNMMRQVAAAVRTGKPEPLAEMASQVARLVGKLTPERIREALKASVARADPGKGAGPSLGAVDIRRDSLRQFSVVSAEPSAPELVFRLEGLRWMLVDVRPNPRPCRAGVSAYCGTS